MSGGGGIEISWRSRTVNVGVSEKPKYGHSFGHTAHVFKYISEQFDFMSHSLVELGSYKSSVKTVPEL